MTDDLPPSETVEQTLARLERRTADLSSRIDRLERLRQEQALDHARRIDALTDRLAALEAQRGET